MATFNLPELGEGLEEGEIVGWKVSEGDSIKTDDTIVEVMTDKATIEVPSPAAGKVTKLHHKVGDVAQVGKPLADIEASGEKSASKPEKQEEHQQQEDQQKEQEKQEQEEQEKPQEEEKREATTGQTTSSLTASAAPQRSTTSSKVLASPAVRKQAREKGIDLAEIQGSGDRGRVLQKDLEGAEASSGSAGNIRALETDERIPFVGVRRKIADSLSKSASTAVHFTHHDEADFSQIISIREERNTQLKKEGSKTKLTYLPFVIKASIAALRKYPILNSYLDTNTNEVVVRKNYHFGISTQTDQGLMVVVVRDCERKGVVQIADDIKSVVERARNGKASREDLSGSTITITSVGNIGGLHATPVINYPEVAIIGMYEIKKRPVVYEIDGEDRIVSAPMAYMNITCDHRIVDGAIAASFMRQLCDYIQNPSRMAFE